MGRVVLAGEALAHGGCGVDDDPVSSVAGSGTSLEPRNDGYMRIYSDTTDKPDRTGRARSARARTWRHRSGMMPCPVSLAGCRRAR